LKATQPGLTQEQADTLKAKWMAAHGRDQRSIAVLNSTTEFHPLTLSPVDSALAEVKRLAIADVAYAFGIAPEVLGVTMGNSATYSNLTQWFRAHRDFGLSPWVDAIGGTLTAVLPGETGVSVNLDGFERPDLSERLANYERALSIGLYTLEEARAMESLPPLPRGASNAVQGPQAQGVPPVEDRQRGGPSGGVQPDQEEGGGLRPDQAEG
jgi:HK97 family phage portal protein